MVTLAFCNTKRAIDFTFINVSHIWSILPRSNLPLKSAGDYPQIVSNRIIRVKPIDIGFLNRFFFNPGTARPQLVSNM